MKNKRVGLYDPYLDSLGGGERHVLSMLQVLEQEANYQPVVYWDEDYTEKITQTLNLHFNNLLFRPNMFKQSSLLTKLAALRNLDIFIYVTDGSYFFSTAKKNYIFCMVPQQNLFTPSLLNQLKTMNYSYICNSSFTQRWLETFGIRAQVLHPYISDDFLKMSIRPTDKENIILVVGRFFEHLHSKRQDIAIQAFLELQKQPQFADYRLILAGSVLPSDTAYLHKLKQIIGTNSSIEIKTNVPFSEILELYKKARFYWHCTGFGLDDTKDPEKVEHFGITPLEAMATGCITFCYNAGGPKEFIHQGKNGFLFQSIPELVDQCQSVISDIPMMREISINARHFVNISFTYTHFKKKVLEVFDIV